METNFHASIGLYWVFVYAKLLESKDFIMVLRKYIKHLYLYHLSVVLLLSAVLDRI